MNMKMYQKLFLSERIISTFHSHFIPFSLLSKFSIDILLPLNLKKKKAAKFKNEMLCHILHSYSLQPLGLPPGRHCFLFIPNSLRPWSIWGHERKFLSRDKERQCSLGIPDTSFSGLSTRTARRVLRSTCVLKWVPAVARMLQRETQRIEVTRAGLSSPVPWGGSWVKEESTWKEHLTSIRVTHLSHHFGILVPNHR